MREATARCPHAAWHVHSSRQPNVLPPTSGAASTLKLLLAGSSLESAASLSARRLSTVAAAADDLESSPAQARDEGGWRVTRSDCLIVNDGAPRIMLVTVDIVHARMTRPHSPCVQASAAMAIRA